MLLVALQYRWMSLEAVDQEHIAVLCAWAIVFVASPVLLVLRRYMHCSLALVLLALSRLLVMGLLRGVAGRA